MIQPQEDTREDTRDTITAAELDLLIRCASADLGLASLEARAALLGAVKRVTRRVHSIDNDRHLIPREGA